MIDSAETDFPLPDSPTRHNVSPAATVNPTPSTGVTRPWSVVNSVLNPSTRSRVDAVTGGVTDKRSSVGRRRTHCPEPELLALDIGYCHQRTQDAPPSA